MTRQEWLDCKDINQMLKQVKSHRKKQLFALACCRSIEHKMLDQRSKDFLVKLELFIDEKIDKKELEEARQAAWSATYPISSAWANAVWTAAMAASWTESTVRWADDTASWIKSAARWAAWAADTESVEQAKQIEFLKDIYNPFLLDFKLSEQAVSLAEQVYNKDDTARFILSDYLEENNYPEELYLHLKQPTHYKGCWVIDQILGKS